MEDNINLVLASDDNYAQHAAITLMSAYESTKSRKRLVSFILDGGISEIKKQKIIDSIKIYNGIVNFVKMDDGLYKNMYTSHQYTSAIYYRLALPNLLNEQKRCIYVDCDLLFYDDIENLWNTDLNNHPIGAIEDVGLTTSKKGRLEKQNNIGLKKNSLYFNSGVIIMDLEQWRKKDYSKEAINLALNNNFKSHDQDVLNKIFMDNWQQIDLRWNVIPPITYMYPKILFSRKYRDKALIAKKNPGILHYAGRYKAWEFKEYPEFNMYYYDLLKKSAFKDEIMPQLSKQNKNRNFNKELLRLKIADFITNIL